MVNVCIVEIPGGVGDGKWRVWLSSGHGPNGFDMVNIGQGMTRAEAMKSARLEAQRILNSILTHE